MLGTYQVIEEISRKLDITLDEAEQMANGRTNDVQSQESLQEINLKIAQSWCSEVCEVVNTYQSSANYEKIDKTPIYVAMVYAIVSSVLGCQPLICTVRHDLRATRCCSGFM